MGYQGDFAHQATRVAGGGRGEGGGWGLSKELEREEGRRVGGGSVGEGVGGDVI